MALSDTKITIQDGGLGAVPAVAGLSAIVGCCSGGTANAPVVVADKRDLTALFGVGPLVDAAAYHLDASGQALLVCKAATDTAGAAGSVTKTGTGTATAAVTGDSADVYDVIVEITRDAANLAALTAALKYSLDGGDTFSQEVAVPVGGAVLLGESGLTITFTNGGSGTSFVTGTRYTFVTTGPVFVLAGAQAALAALFDAPGVDFGFIHLVGAASATIAAGVQATLDAQKAAFRFVRAVLETRDQNAGESLATWRAAINTDFVSLVADRVAVAKGYAEIVDPLRARVRRRSVAWPACARLASVALSQHPAEFDGGALKGVTKLHQDDRTADGEGLSARFVTARTYAGKSGFFLAGFPTMAAPGSDFAEVMNCRVIDRACVLARAEGLLELNKRLPVDPATGKILETAARSIEQRISAVVSAGLVGEVSSLSVLVDRAVNVLSLKKLVLRVVLVPFGYASAVEIVLGFDNPATRLN